ncbi:hypothetical protein F5144DRAFT_337071 [Chaetomium tenue]|uniref:Uncharacterized protein n=1 Tax=Chaetomium tenue TaxID=1854479 RepID=A0ACB7NWJ3_9PEZI|nr:hypothetical protein F5144DRAFT_337071 [Chaetomium globosum]
MFESASRRPSAISHQPSAISHQPSAISHQPSAISHQPSAISHQPSAISHQPSAIGHQPFCGARRDGAATPASLSPEEELFFFKGMNVICIGTLLSLELWSIISI